LQNAIVSAADSKYLPAACCALLSCIEDGGAAGQAEFFLLACDVSSEEANKAKSFLKDRNVLAEIIKIGEGWSRPYRIDSYVSASSYSRLLLPEFFSDQWDRIIYLDADVRVMVKLETLLGTNLRGRPMAAVHDYLRYLIYGMEECRTRLSMRSDSPYFNAGVICFDWRATIGSELLTRAQAFARESAHLCKSHDQDALNKAFEGAWTPLDPRWNYMVAAIPDYELRLHYPAIYQPFIAHFAGAVKPWTPDFPERFEHHRAWYRNLLRDSPWPHFTAPFGAPSTRRFLRARRAKEWLLNRRRMLQGNRKRLSVAAFEAAREVLRNSKRWKSSSNVRWKRPANTDLADLLKQMIAEAASTD
jgi:lipopolysaccharide biosynthesis glycosyltransferase